MSPKAPSVATRTRSSKRARSGDGAVVDALPEGRAVAPATRARAADRRRPATKVAESELDPAEQLAAEDHVEQDGAQDAEEDASSSDGVDADEIEQAEEDEKNEEDAPNDDEGAFFASTLKELVVGAGAKDAAEESEEDQDEEGDTVLRKRKTREMKEIEKAKREMAEAKRLRAEKRARREQGLVQPELQNVVFERQLRRVATRGVVVLFNAIQKHQSKARVAGKLAAKDAPATAAKGVKEATKETFLDLLKKGATEASAERGAETAAPRKEAVEGSAGSGGWGALREDYMLGAKMRDFEQEVELEDEDELGAELEEED